MHAACTVCGQDRFCPKKGRYSTCSRQGPKDGQRSQFKFKMGSRRAGSQDGKGAVVCSYGTHNIICSLVPRRPITEHLGMRLHCMDSHARIREKSPLDCGSTKHLSKSLAKTMKFQPCTPRLHKFLDCMHNCYVKRYKIFMMG